MEIKPQSFFIGVVDFFSVWLPGAILTWFLKLMFYDPAFEKALRIPPNEIIQVIFFLLVTYIIGSILFGFSSLLDNFYDKKLRKIIKPKDKDHIELEVKTATAIRNTFINADQWIMKHHESGLLSNEQVKKLYSKEYRYIINTYKWSQHYLLYKSPEALADVKRVEADSKFFRSLVLTFLIISLLLFLNGSTLIQVARPRINVAAIFLLLSGLSLYLFSTFRYKSTIRAYELVITHYYLQTPPATAPTTTTGVSSSVIQSELDPSFISKHKKLLDYLFKGWSQQPKGVRINAGEFSGTFFTSNKNEYWYCLSGKGSMNIKTDGELSPHFLQPNAILPLTKGIDFSFTNKQNEPLELIVISS
ncbi:MAG: hypothetical protein EOO13_15720 [Chitinophagaceae bacterium]|nr:MAG: hypothetical protein EOO13_15720 [Chitinophagaceae bacterium]